MKNLILSLCAGLLLCTNIKAQTAGPSGGSSFSTAPISGSNQSWQNTGNIGASDDQFATFGNLTGGAGSYTNYLTANDFHFNIPDNAVIDGIKVTVECSDPNEKTADYSVRIIKTSQLGNDDKATGTNYPVQEDKELEYGGAADLWSETWIPKQINDNFFGVAIAAQRNADAGVTAGRVDMISITIYYHVNITLPVTLNSFIALKENKTVAVNWKTSDETAMKQYVVERSSDGRNFITIGTAISQNLPVASYNFRDNNPLTGVSYYRLKMEHLSSSDTYSKIAVVSFGKYSLITLSPSPCINCNNLMINNPGKEELTIQFFTADGKLIGKTATSTSQVTMPVLAETKGIVYFRVTDKNNERRGSGTLMVQ